MTAPLHHSLGDKEPVSKTNKNQSIHIIQHVNKHINRIQNKSYIISIHVEKVLDKIQFPFMAKTVNKLGIEENVLKSHKGICKKSTGNMVLNGERLKAFP